MATDPNLMKSADFAKVSEIDFVNQFHENIINSLTEMLGITRKVEKVPGQVIKSYRVIGELKNGEVAEGEDIPLSKYETEVVDTFELKAEKYRKKTTYEAINDKGYEQAVTDTDDKMITDIQKGIRSKFINFLATGEGSASGVGLQGALAQTWGQLKMLFADYDVAESDLVYFVSPLDIADYLTDKDITTQTVFGFTYIENFLGLYNVLIHASIPQGVVYGTALNNIILYYTNPSNSDVSKAFDFTIDATGYVGIHHDVNYTNLTTDTIALCGVALYAELIDRVVVGSIAAKPAESVTLSQKTMSLGVEETKQLSATVIPAEAGKATFASSAPDKATVDPDTGLVTGVAAGSTNITATVGNKTSAACVVTVTGE